jgi:hypothetical protein
VTGTSVAVAIFFGALGVWPQLAILRRPGLEPNVLRSLLLGASLAIIFGLATVFVFYGLLALQRWRWAMSSGYPSWVVADVMCDAQRDAGNLINGSADFALVAGPTRRALLALRRTRLLLQIVAALIALAGIGRWVAVWLMGGGSEAAQDVAMRWATPIMIVYILYFIAGAPEWRVRRRERTKVAGRPSGENVPPLRGELVKMWMASAERARKSLSGDVAGKDK